MKYQFINYSVKNRVARIALNSPATLNAINHQMRIELMDVVELIEKDDDVRIVILTGEGRAFCAGADLTEGLGEHDTFVEQCAAEYTPWLMGIHDSKKLYIAAANGACAGIGSAVVLNCDLIVMAEDAYLYQAFSAIGLMPDGGATVLLLENLGYQRALEMAVDAGKLSAQQCLEYGIVNKVVASDKLLLETQVWAEKLAAGAPLAQASAKQLMRKAAQMSYAEVVDEEARLQTKLIQSDDAAIGTKAFFAKEKPQFTGK